MNESGANLLDPDTGMLIWSVLSFLLSVGIPVAIFVFARRLLRAVERRSVREAEVAELTERVQRLEARLEDMADENDRLREEQRFTQQLLTDRGRRT